MKPTFVAAIVTMLLLLISSIAFVQGARDSDGAEKPLEEGKIRITAIDLFQTR